MQTHPRPSQEIAEAMIARLLPRYPQPVELPRETCGVCDGSGDIDPQRERHIHPDDRTPCRRCKGAGTVRVWCSFCKRPATTVLYDDDGYRWEACSDCGLGDEPTDVAIAWGLRQGMAAVMEAVR